MRAQAVSLILCALVLSAAGVARSQEQPAPPAQPPQDATDGGIDFVHHVMPLVNKLGCNATKCHGSQSGKGGFQLSMFGAEPELDYTALVREAAGRRVDRVEPARSLFLLKATAAIKHGGGERIKGDSPQYRKLVAWVAQGAPYSLEGAPELVSVKAAPEAQSVAKGQSQQLAVTAVYSDGTEKDVTADAQYGSTREQIATVDEAGKVQAQEFGQAGIVVGYARKFAVARIAVPQPLSQPFPDLPANNKIDELVVAKLEELGFPPSDLCSDEVFLRRVYLDVIGTLPTPDEARAFLADADPKKRSKLIDRLLASDEFADFWALKWGDLFRIKSEYPSNLWPNAVQAYYHWVRNSIAENKPYDQFARELLTSSGSNFREPPVNYYRAFLTREPQNLAEVTALIFMGARIGCARCHAHPSEDWDIDDSAGLAAFFADVRYKSTTEWKEEIVFADPRRTLRHPRTGEVVAPKFPGGPAPEIADGQDPREVFADWLTAPDNPWFPRNIVNRTWFWLLGRGIIQDPDDLRSTNPPSNPELLAYLEGELTGHDYDLKHVYRLILNSRTYQLSAKANERNRADTALFSHYYVKRLGAETLLDAIGQVTDRWDTYRSSIPEPFVVMPAGFRATHLPDGSIGIPFLELFGRPPRDTAFESDRDLKLSMRQTLHLLNSSDVQNKINGSPKLRQLISEVKEDPKVIEEIYLATLSRMPTEEEKQGIRAYMSGEGQSSEALVQAQAEKKAAEEALAKAKEELDGATAAYDAAEKAAKEAEAAAAAKTDDKAALAEAQKSAAEKRTAANAAKANRDKLAGTEKAAAAKLAGADKKLASATAALKPRRDQAIQDLVWAVLNTKEFLFIH